MKGSEQEFFKWSVPCTDELGALRDQVKVIERSFLENYTRGTTDIDEERGEEPGDG